MNDEAFELQAAGGTSGAMAHDDDELLAALRGLLDAAASGLDSQSPARARTSVAISVQDGDEAPRPWAVLYLDREPVAIEPGDGRAEAELTFPRESLRRFVSGDLQLALAIARGEVAFHGPVRKFLRITPILRALARNEASGVRPGDLE